MAAPIPAAGRIVPTVPRNPRDRIRRLSTEGVTMGLKASIDAAAKAANLTDATDLPGLVALGGLLEQVASEAEQDGDAEIRDRSRAAAELAERIVLRQVDDLERAFTSLMDAIGLCESANERREAPPHEPADPELLAAWVASTDAVLPEIEHLAVRAEREGLEGEVAAEIRRRIHTLKGECGVLSLAEAQSICHDLESRLESSGSVSPTDAILATCDWMRTLVQSLARDPAAPEPDTAELRRILAGESSTPHLQPNPAPTASPGSSGRSHVTPAQTVPCDPADTAPSDGDLDLDATDGARVVMDLSHADENTADFALEAREHLANAENAVLALESGAEDPELVNVVFRAFHTIKGVAGFLNLPRIVEVAHAAEFLLDKVRSSQVALSPRVLELVLASTDLLGQLIGMLSGGDAPFERDLGALVRALDAACRGDSSPAPSPVPATATAANESSLAPAPASTPPATVGRGAPSSAPSSPASAGAPRPATTTDAPATSASPSRSSAVKSDQSVKVSTQRMDNLVNLVGELVIAQLMVVQDPIVSGVGDQRVQRNLSHLGKIVRDLQETAMSLRMVTLKATFQKMARLVRDVSAKAGKRIQLEVEGEDVELDRNVVEEIGDPLVHMIRNACDHGIEPADDRRAAGKSEQGTLRLRAFHSGGSIVIEVEDDGRGLSRERILRKCVERGLIDVQRNLDEIPDAEVFNYIFLPGFSTAEKVTDISGRGVGMDVVRRNIEALRGSVEIRSNPGRGSVFSMRLPLTMAIIDGMVVRVGSQRYIVPTLNIERSFRPEAGELTTVLGKGEMARVREELLPIYRLRRVFGLSEGADSIGDGLLLLLEHGKRRGCVFVDEILGQQQVVIKNLGDSQPPIRGVSGGAILGDGLVALIVDVGGLLETAATPASA
jgi:two-component system chemotaxis sensor kinase CheA